MGAVCQTQQQKLQNYRLKQQIEQRKRQQIQKLNNHIYSQKIRKYTQLYGRQITDQTKQFVQKNYNRDYCSETRSQGYPRSGELTLTYKDRVLDRLETAKKNGNYTNKLQFIKLDQGNKYMNYKWQIKTSSKIAYYDVVAYFDDQDNFRKAIFDQREPPYDHAKYMASYVPPPVPKNNYNNQQSSSNNYYEKPKDWGAYYDAQVQQSNAQFRDNMNKQAQQWNNYQQQKANRGW